MVTKILPMASTGQNESFFDLTEKKCAVKGIAVKSGVSRNGIMYTGEELRNFARTMEGVSIIKDHEAIVDNAVGVVESTSFNDADESVLYEGWIKNGKLAEQVKDGRVKHVSIGAIVGKLVKEEEDSDYLIAKDMTCCELSTVVVPGVPGASIQQSIQDSKPIHENVSGISKIKTSSQEQFKTTEEVKVKMEEKVKEPQVEEKVDEDITKMQELKKQLAEDVKALKEQKDELMKEAVKEAKEMLVSDIKKLEEKAEEEKLKEEEVKVKPKEKKSPVEDKTVGEVKTEDTTTEAKSETGVVIERGEDGWEISRTNFDSDKLTRLRR